MLLGDRLRLQGLTPAAILAHRIVLHPDDALDTTRSTADLERNGHALTYQRLQDGLVFGQETVVACFIAETGGRARCFTLRRLVARRPGSVPGDIVYDPEFAHLLHNFISRAKTPTFYDAFEMEAGAALAGLTVGWPAGGDVVAADSPALRIVASPSATEGET